METNKEADELREFFGAWPNGAGRLLSADLNAALARERQIGREEAVREIVRESAVVYEAEPPGIDYVTLQVDMHTWAEWQRMAGLNASDPRDLATHPLNASESPLYASEDWESGPAINVGDASESPEDE